MNIFEMINTIRSSNNPMAFLQSQAGNNPAIAKALEMTKGKNPNEFLSIAQNVAKERGIDLNQYRQSLGI